jgi:hypothetical protein
MTSARVGFFAGLVALLLAASGCSSSPSVTSVPPITPATSPTSAPAATSTSASPAASPSSPSPTAPAEASAPATFKHLSAACPLLPVSDFEQVSGQSALTTHEVPTSPGPSETLLGCEFLSGSQVDGAITVDILPATGGESAQQYLAADIAASKYNYGLSQKVPGLGDAAKFGTARGGAGLIGSAWFIQLRGGDVAHLTISCLDPSGAEAPIVALARDLLAAV